MIESIYIYIYVYILNCSKVALAGVAQWIECQPVNRGDRWFGSQSEHMPGLRAKSPVGVCEGQPVHVSLTH